MASEPRLEEPEPISPELVLVSPPDVARRAREGLREPALARAAAAPAADDRSPGPATGVVAEPPRSPSKRRRRSRALTGVIVGLAAAAAVAGGYFVGAHYIARRADDGSAVQAPRVTSAPRTNGGAAQTQRTATTATGTAHPQRRHAATATRPAPRTRTRSAKRTAAAKPTKRTATAKRTKPRSAVAGAAGFVPPRTWAWAKSKGARAYRLKFLLNGRLVLKMRTTRAHVVLRSSFRFRAGTYRWIVERIPPAPQRRPIVDSTFALTRAVAARANR
jgi:hypothetical protein